MEKKLRELLNQVISSEEQESNSSEESTSLSEEEQLEMQKSLIHIANLLFGKLNIDFGDENTGELNIQNLQKLKQDIDELKKLFDEVYTFDGEIRACGRNKCVKLIEAASYLYPHMYLGDTDTGKMQVLNLLSIRNTLFVEYQA